MTVGIWEGGYSDSEKLIETLQDQASLFSSPTADWLSMTATAVTMETLGSPEAPRDGCCVDFDFECQNAPITSSCAGNKEREKQQLVL